MYNSFWPPWTVAHQALQFMGFPRQENWSGLPFPSPGDLPDPRIIPTSHALQVDSLPLNQVGSPWQGYYPSLELRKPKLRLCLDDFKIHTAASGCPRITTAPIFPDQNQGLLMLEPVHFSSSSFSTGNPVPPASRPRVLYAGSEDH